MEIKNIRDDHGLTRVCFISCIGRCEGRRRWREGRRKIKIYENDIETSRRVLEREKKNFIQNFFVYMMILFK
jgi:hypothetical protein